MKWNIIHVVPFSRSSFIQRNMSAPMMMFPRAPRENMPKTSTDFHPPSLSHSSLVAVFLRIKKYLHCEVFPAEQIKTYSMLRDVVLCYFIIIHIWTAVTTLSVLLSHSRRSFHKTFNFSVPLHCPRSLSTHFQPCHKWVLHCCLLWVYEKYFFKHLTATLNEIKNTQKIATERGWLSDIWMYLMLLLFSTSLLESAM